MMGSKSCRLNCRDLSGKENTTARCWCGYRYPWIFSCCETRQATLWSLCSPTTKIWKVTQNVESWVDWELGVTQGHWQCHHSIERIW